MTHTESVNAFFNMKIKIIWASLIPRDSIVLLSLNWNENIKCDNCLCILTIKTLFKLILLLSIRQYSLRRNYFRNNPQVKFPGRMGCFHEINTLHSRRKWHSGVCVLGTCLSEIHLSGSLLLVGRHPDINCHLLLLWYGHRDVFLDTTL